MIEENQHNIEVWGVDESGSIGNDIIFSISHLIEEYEYLPFIYNLAFFDELIVDKYRFIHRLENKSCQAYEFLKAIRDCDKISFRLYSMLSWDQMNIIKKFINLEFDSIYLMRGKFYEGIEKLDKDILWDVFSELRRFDKRKDKSYKEKQMWLKNKLNSYDAYLDKFIKSYTSYLIFKKEYKKSRLINDPNIEPFLVLTFIDGGLPHSCWYDMIRDKHTPIYGVARGDETYPSMYVAGLIAHSYRYLSKDRHSFIFSDFNVENILPTTKDDLNDMIDVYEHFKNVANSPSYSIRVKIMGDIDKYIPTIKNIIPYLLHKERRHDKRFKYTIFEPHLGEMAELKEKDVIIFTDEMEEKAAEFLCKKISLSSIAQKVDNFMSDLMALTDDVVLAPEKITRINKKLTYIKNKAALLV